MSAQIIPSRTPAETALAETFGAVKGKLPGTAAIAKLREDSFGAFAEAGLPHRRVESWHYTDLRTIMREALPLAPIPDAVAIEGLRKDFAQEPIAGVKLVVVDGVFVPELSDQVPAGVTVSSLASVLSGDRADLIAALSAQGLGTQDSIVSLNAAMMQDGVVIEIAPGTQVAEALNIIYATASSTPVARFSRSLVVVGEGATASIAESSFGDGGRTGQTNGALIFAVGDHAKVNHTAALTGSQVGSIRVESFMVSLGAKAKFDSFALITGAGLLRRQIFMRFNGEDAESSLRGAALLRGREYADTTLFVEHIAPGCVGRELFKYILDEEAVGVFQGKIHVAPEAQKTDGKMLCKALLLTDTVAMNNKPELEIFADDVACAHGATCGGLNEDQLFYLEARGLPYTEAESLLLEAFAGELVDEIEDEKLVEAFRGEISAWLAARAKS
jgi:Fe-S cluster assembly protein SufD